MKEGIGKIAIFALVKRAAVFVFENSRGVVWQQNLNPEAIMLCHLLRQSTP